MQAHPRSRVALYARISTDKQDLERQLVELRDYASRRGLTVAEEVTEIESGAVAGRSGLSRLQELAHQRRIDLILVWEMSRLTRRGIGALFSLLAEFDAEGVRVESLREPFLSAEGPVRPLLLSIFAWVGEQERVLISERTKSSLRQRKALGIRLGAEPLCECGHRRKALRRQGGKLVHGRACHRCPCESYRPRTGMTGGMKPTSTDPTPR